MPRMAVCWLHGLHLGKEEIPPIEWRLSGREPGGVSYYGLLAVSVGIERQHRPDTDLIAWPMLTFRRHELARSNKHAAGTLTILMLMHSTASNLTWGILTHC